MSVIYFLQIADWGPIKIGYSAKSVPMRRIMSLQTASPWSLNLLGRVAGNKAHERYLHERLAAHRMRGEWFEAEPLVIDAVSEVLADGFCWSEKIFSDLDRAISLAGSQTHLCNAIGVSQPEISVSRKLGMSRNLRGRVEAFLREGVSA